ncbi:uncharacterized protein LOC117831349 isoform X2 [Notolabrus celidotus]|uniref:uncharacterized protein LOC117831349 isoform X2 n=1 Tax=Notolabrus celidotus TaxID=1203425 RepID=UPI00148FE694|nr:uncharacterized protein LOC117831349 isoform X2 [Notolabrus celidotus]
MENQCVDPVQPQDPASCHRTVSARRAGSDRRSRARKRCPCCRDEQQQHSAPSARPPQKRKRTSAAPPSRASAEPLVPRPWSPIPPDELPVVSSVAPRPRSPIPPDELPVVSSVAPSPRPSTSTSPLQPDSDLRIHNRSVEEYQRIYHEVVDDMLKFKSGRPRPYSLELGRRIKQKLWERLNCPTFTETVDENGLVHGDASHGVGVYPPQYDVDTSGEPQPETPLQKRARK